MQTKIKFQAFGKTNPPTGRAKSKGLRVDRGLPKGWTARKKTRKFFGNNLKPY